MKKIMYLTTLVIALSLFPTSLTGCKKPRGPFALEVPQSFPKTAQIGSNYSYTFRQPDTITSFSGPSWGNFDRQSRTFSGTPGPNDFGTFPISLEGETKEQLFTFSSVVTVASPSIKPIKPIRIPVNQNKSYAIEVQVNPPSSYKIQADIGQQPNSLQRLFSPQVNYKTNNAGKVVLKPIETLNDVPGNGTLKITIISSGEANSVSLEVPIEIYK